MCISPSLFHFSLRSSLSRSFLSSTRGGLANAHARADNRYAFVVCIRRRARKKRETERNTMANGILLFQMGPARIFLLRSQTRGSEECRHEIILQYLTVRSHPSPRSPPMASPVNPKVNPKRHPASPRRAVRPCLRAGHSSLSSNNPLCPSR